jgi:hypothetical protein
MKLIYPTTSSNYIKLMVNLAAQMRGNKKEWKKYIQEKK